eukprot:7379382-Prymnesium_polylepis.1
MDSVRQRHTERGGEGACEQGWAGQKRSGCAAAGGGPGRDEGGKRAPRRAGGRAAADTLGEGRKRDAQAAS